MPIYRGIFDDGPDQRPMLIVGSPDQFPATYVWRLGNSEDETITTWTYARIGAGPHYAVASEVTEVTEPAEPVEG